MMIKVFLLLAICLRVIVRPQECNRPCTGITLTCRYTFVLEWYLSLSKACFNCPNVRSDCFRPDCVVGGGFQRSVITVNRMLPGPPIEVCQGDRVEVQLVNNLGSGESTSIHWHGQHQTESPYMDGVPYLTQCPIATNSNFTYSFVAETPGTHFYHSHTGSQRGDGLYGAFVVRTPEVPEPLADTYDYDLSTHVVLISEWTRETRQDQFLRYYHSGQPFVVDSILVNGLGFPTVTEENGNWPLARFTVTRGSRYRFRVINAGFNDCPIELAIDRHNLTMISSDGQDFVPTTVDSFMSYAGERFDFILDANQPPGQYWMRFRGNIFCRHSRVFQLAIIQYAGTENQRRPPNALPTFENFTAGLQLNDVNNTYNNLVNMTSVTTPDVPLSQEQNLIRRYIEFDFNSVDNPMFHRYPYYGFYQVTPYARAWTPQFDRITYADPPRPLLQNRFVLRPRDFCTPETLRPDDHCEGNFCQCTYLIQVPLNAVVEFIFVDVGNYANDAVHPIHLHGHSFRLLGTERLGRNSTVHYVRELDTQGLLQRNYNNPPLKDNVGVPHGGYTIIRFRADNPGFWFMHCHVDPHLELGMAMVVQVGNPTQMHLTPPNFPTCGSYPST